jgi:hypothetical protein
MIHEELLELISEVRQHQSELSWTIYRTKSVIMRRPVPQCSWISMVKNLVVMFKYEKHFIFTE